MVLEGKELVFKNNKFRYANDVGSLTYSGNAIKLFTNNFTNVITEESFITLISPSITNVNSGDRIKLNSLNEDDFVNEHFTFNEGLMLGVLYSGGSLILNERIDFIDFGSLKVCKDIVINCLHNYKSLQTFYNRVSLLDETDVSTFINKYKVFSLQYLPKILYIAGFNFLIGFLTGFLLNGYISERKLIFNSRRISLFIELSKLLLFYGIESSIYKIAYKKSYFLYRMTFSCFQLNRLNSLGEYGLLAFEYLFKGIPIDTKYTDRKWIKINKLKIVVAYNYDMYLVPDCYKHFILTG